jgi:hypothetical protein
VTAGIACAADTLTLAGKWKLHSSIQGYEGELQCHLTQDGQNVAGTCKSAETPGTLAMNGKIESKQVVLQYKTMYNGDELTIIYTASVENTDKFSGRVDVQPMGVEGEFTATPVK